MPATNRLRQPRQAQERRLKYVVGIGGIVDQAAGRPEHHRAVPFEENLEGPVVIGLDELPQELAVRLAPGFGGHLVEEVSQGLNGTAGHTG